MGTGSPLPPSPAPFPFHTWHLLPLLGNNIELFSLRLASPLRYFFILLLLSFLSIVLVVVFIICSTYTSRKSTLECVCVRACVCVRGCVCQCCRCPLPKILDEQLLFSHHNHKRYKHNYYFYVPALIVKQQIACLGPTCA